MPSSVSRERNARLVNAVPLLLPSVNEPCPTSRSAIARSNDRGRRGGAAADVERLPGDFAGAAVDRGVQVAPAVLGDPDRRHVQMPELVGPRDLEVAGPAPASLRADR